MQVEQQEQEDKVDEEQYLEEEEVKFLSPLFSLLHPWHYCYIEVYFILKTGWQGHYPDPTSKYRCHGEFGLPAGLGKFEFGLRYRPSPFSLLSRCLLFVSG